jgi:hypothetical protein
MLDSYLRTPYAFTSATLQTISIAMLDPGMSIDRVSQVVHEGEYLHKVEFRYLPPDDPVRKSLRSGWVLLDSNRYWVMRAFEVHTKLGDKLDSPEVDYVADYQYADASGRFPILSRAIVRRNIPAQKLEYETTITFELREADLPETDFRLSGFGFPEPPGAPPVASGSRWYLWLIGAAVLLIGSGWYIRHRLRTRPAAVAPTAAK